MKIHARFWVKETPPRLRSWWRRHWWPARIRQLDRERSDWKRWCISGETTAEDYHNQLEMAWGVIANATDWDRDDRSEWRTAAERWRDKYHEGMVSV